MTRGEIFATCSATSCAHGQVTGVLTKQDFKNQFLPNLATNFSAMVTRDCAGPDPASCMAGSTGQMLQFLFDDNADLAITATELSKNSLIKTLLVPDVDLNHDKVKDALSVGFGFATVHAKLVR